MNREDQRALRDARRAEARAARRDRARTLVTPEGIALPIRLASRGARLGALIVDLVLIAVTLVLTTIAIAVAAGAINAASGGALSKAGLGQADLGKADKGLFWALQAIAVAYIALLFLLRHGYFLFFELGPRGATPGKRLTGIRIAARDGGRLSPEMVLARNLLRDVELFLPLALLVMTAASGGAGNPAMGLAATCWFGIFALFALFNRDRLRAGDLIGGTWVIEAPRHRLGAVLSASAGPASGARYRFGEAELAVYGEYELQTLERVLREGREEAMVAVHAAICRKIGWDPGSGDERAFLEAYYTQLRARLEAGMRLGRRKADKHAGGG